MSRYITMIVLSFDFSLVIMKKKSLLYKITMITFTFLTFTNYLLHTIRPKPISPTHNSDPINTINHLLRWSSNTTIAKKEQQHDEIWNISGQHLSLSFIKHLSAMDTKWNLRLVVSTQNYTGRSIGNKSDIYDWVTNHGWFVFFPNYEP